MNIQELIKDKSESYIHSLTLLLEAHPNDKERIIFFLKNSDPDTGAISSKEMLFHLFADAIPAILVIDFVPHVILSPSKYKEGGLVTGVQMRPAEKATVAKKINELGKLLWVNVKPWHSYMAELKRYWLHDDSLVLHSLEHGLSEGYSFDNVVFGGKNGLH